MDLDRLFQATFDELESPAADAVFPGFPGDGHVSGKEQVIDMNGISRLSRVSRLEKRSLSSDRLFAGEKHDVSDVGGRAKSVLFETPGNPGNPGKGEETLAESETYNFPASSSFPGKIEGNREIEGLPAGSDPLPVTPADVRAGVERELRFLAEDGREGPTALRDAVEITRAKIRNSEALAERQAHAGQCHVCDAALDDAAPVVAVLSGSRGGALYLHAGCHDAYRARRAGLVDQIMTAAGYGVEADGEAA